MKQAFSSRFSLRGDAVWRLMGLLRPYRRLVVFGNIFKSLASTMAAVGLVALLPLFKVILEKPAVASAPASMQVEKQDASVDASKIEAAKPDASKPASSAGEVFVEKKFGGLSDALHLHLGKRIKDWYHAQKANFIASANESPKRFVAFYVFGILILFLIKGCFDFFGDLMLAKAYILAVRDIMSRTFGNVLRQEMAFFDNTATGELLNICYREVMALNSMFDTIASSRIVDPINMLILYVALIVISPILALTLLLLLPLVIIPAFAATRYLRGQLKSELGLESGIMDMMTQSLHGVQTVKAFGAEVQQRALLDPMLESYVHSTRMRRAAQSFIGPAVDFINLVVMLLVFWVALSFLPSSASLEPERLMAFMFAITRFYKPMRSIMTMNIRMQRMRSLANRIFTLMDRKPLIQDVAAAADFPSDWREIEFSNVHLAYKVRRKGKMRTRKVLRRVYFKIARGEAIGLVGPNGAGKSSLAHLLIRLYDATAGEIRIGGAPVPGIRLDQLRRNICMITQHPVLFNISAEENIVFGLSDIPHAKVEAAARATGAAEFIEELPHGYESTVGEGGRLLSGGERQKIALARALVRDPQLVIFDEPTSSLDVKSIELVLAQIDALRARGVTVILITHDARQLDKMDRILQLTDEQTVVDATQSFRRPAGADPEQG